MKILSQTAFDMSSRYILNNARYLEKLVFGHNFISPCPEKIVKAYKMYQNKDGGYGNGLEPDFRLPFSSPLATSVALGRLRDFKEDLSALEQIEKAIVYLESTYDDSLMGWECTSKMVNLYPHAPWWTYNAPQQKVTGNPSAELLGYLIEFKRFVKILDLEVLTETYIQYFINLESFEAHEVYCFIKLYNALSDIEQQRMEPTLMKAFNQLVVLEESEWHNYVAYPIKFTSIIDKPIFDIKPSILEANIDYLMGQIEKEGVVSPSWAWQDYLEEWEIAKREWIGILTLDALLIFKKNNAIVRDQLTF